MQLNYKKKILLVSLSNKGGGASKIVSELYNSLLKSDLFDVKLLIFDGYWGPNITIINSNKWERFFFIIKNRFAKGIYFLFDNKNYQSVNFFPSSLLRKINNSDADLVHLHWIGAEMISIEQLARINKKIIWTLHDSWPLNGSCHINPNEYDSNYEISDVKDEKFISLIDEFTLARKIKYLSNLKITFTAPSYWILEKYNKSIYNKDYSKCSLIPNFIDLSKWKILDKTYARSILNISTSKTLLVFGAANINKSFNKGFHFIIEMCKHLNPNDFAFIIFGNSINESLFDKSFEFYFFHDIIDEIELYKIYSAGDITIVPSYSESFSMVSLESISCNTPVLAFNTSGIRDIITHKENGYLARKFDLNDLLRGINWLLNNNITDVRNSALKFSINNVLPQFCEIYNK